MRFAVLCLTAALLSATAIRAAGIASSKKASSTKEVSSAEKSADSTTEQAPPRIQLAILLDTSNSMDGLINQARTQLWKIVNELAATKRCDATPHLEVALYEYGNDSISAAKLHVRRAAAFTEDLDCISEKLFALTTYGGQEYCGAVIDKAVNDLDWSKSGADLKTIVIAGNEPFSQGPVDDKTACQDAIARGITVTTIFCGPHEVGIDTGWKDGAVIAEGSYLSIDQDEAVVTIPTPYDDKLAKLSMQINATFLFYGDQKQARASAERQEAQDKNAASVAPAAAAQRAAFKASVQYQRATKDLVEALATGSVKLENLDADELPTELRSRSPEQQRQLIKEKREQRQRIQGEIQKLTKQRQRFLDEARPDEGDEAQNTLDGAVLQAVRELAARKQFTPPDAN